MLLLQLQIHETFGAKYCTGRMWFCFYSDAALLFSTPDTKRSLKFISVSHNPNVEKRCTLWNGFHFYPAKNIRSDKAATKQFTVIKLFCITRAVNVNVLSWNNVEVSRVIVSGDIRLMNCRLAPCAQSQKVYRMSNFGSRRRSKKKKKKGEYAGWMHLFLSAWIVFGFILPTRGCASFQSCLLPSWAPVSCSNLSEKCIHNILWK